MDRNERRFEIFLVLLEKRLRVGERNEGAYGDRICHITRECHEEAEMILGQYETSDSIIQ